MRPDHSSADELKDRFSEPFFATSGDAQRARSAASDPVFLCPGQSQPVSRAVHLARLNAAWSVCDQCEWRDHTEGLAASTIDQTERIREHRLDSLRRTECGIRGPYVNALDRSLAADFARVFCRCFAEFCEIPAASDPRTHSTDTAHLIRTTLKNRSPDDPGGELAMTHEQPAFGSISPIVLGYDGRSSSLDLFAGVLAAVRECGFPVIDIGRCTAASLTAAVRTHETCIGSLLVTGSGTPGSWNGLDALDVGGDPIPVLWKNFSIRLHHGGSENVPGMHTPRNAGLASPEPRDDSAVDRMLRRIRGELAEQTDSADPSSSKTAASTTSARRILKLELPHADLRKKWAQRLVRESGDHRIIEFESAYREWLGAWFPSQGTSRILIRTDDRLICERIEWLKQRTGLELIPRAALDDSETPACRLSLSIDEDDRNFQLFGRRGERIEPERLALLINRATQSTPTHVSAHGDHASGRFWLSDSVRSGASLKTHRIRDSLAVAGLVVRLLESGHLLL
ncbi:MAG: hypothetical protein ACK58L_02305 [Planctomycetota bacterium]